MLKAVIGATESPKILSWYESSRL